MIQLLVTVMFLETVTIMVLLFKSPLRKLVIMGLDRAKRGRGPVILETLGVTVLMMLLSSFYSILKIENRSIEDGAVNPTDRVLMAKHRLEVTLTGGILFLALMIDGLHLYIKELQIRRKNMESMSKTQEREAQKIEEIKSFKEERARLRAELKGLEFELQSKIKNRNVAKVNAVALRRQSWGCLLEHDRILKENQNLLNQLQSFNNQTL